MIDLVFVLNLQAQLTVLSDAVTDHRPLRITIPSRRETPRVKEVLTRDFKSLSRADLIMHINASELSQVFQEDDVDVVTSIIVGELEKVLDLLAPPRRVLVRERSRPLSLSEGTRRLMRERDEAARCRDWELYRRLRNLTARRVRKDRLHSNWGFLMSCSKDPGKLWRMADDLTGRSRIGALPPELVGGDGPVRGDEGMAEELNCHYISKVQRIREGIERERPAQPQHPQQQQHRHRAWSNPGGKLLLSSPSETAVVRAISNLKCTPALGEDGVPVQVLKDLAPVLAAPLAHLASCSFSSGKFPSLFKLANVVPVPKRGKDPSLPSSYRPVSLLPACSKVLEGLALQQLTPHLSLHLPNEQWGFRTGRSTAAALAAAHGAWWGARTLGRSLAVAAYDFSSAFDTLGVEELTGKLEELDLGEESISWVQDYLSGRRQRVRVGSSTSSFRDVLYGVPQGSLLGPSLFISLIFDLPTALGLTDDDGVTMYADDCCIWTSHKEPRVVKSRLEVLSGRLLRFALENTLSLNSSKTQIMWSGPGAPPSINVGPSVVPIGRELLLLGVVFDDKLSMAPHMRALVGTAKSLSALTRRLLHHLPRGRQVQDVVRALVRGRLGYACMLLPVRLKDEDPTCQLLQTVQVQINDMARALLGRTRADQVPVETLLNLSGMPSLNRIAVRTVLLELWKSLRSCDGPDGSLNPLGRLLNSEKTPSRRTRSTQAGDLPPPLRKSADTFIWTAHKLYNEVTSLRSASTLAAASRIADSFVSTIPL